MRLPRTALLALTFCLLIVAAPTAHSAPRLAAKGSAPVMGSKKMFNGYGTGWGTVKPKKLGDGTDCGSVISGIHWHRWGGATAHGTGRTCPNESKSRKLKTIRLLPTGLRVCHGTHRQAYSKLLVRYPDGHGGFRAKKPWLGIRNFCG